MAVHFEINRHVSTNILMKTLGTYATQLLCKRFGGREALYVPVSCAAESPIRDVIGDLNFAKLVKVVGGMVIGLPRGVANKKAEIMDAVQGGQENTRRIAARFGVTGRYVRRIRQELRAIGIPCPLPEKPPSHKPPIKKTAIINAHKNGLRSIDEIARKTGASAGYVSETLKNIDRSEAENG